MARKDHGEYLLVETNLLESVPPCLVNLHRLDFIDILGAGQLVDVTRKNRKALLVNVNIIAYSNSFLDGLQILAQFTRHICGYPGLQIFRCNAHVTNACFHRSLDLVRQLNLPMLHPAILHQLDEIFNDLIFCFRSFRLDILALVVEVVNLVPAYN